MNIEVTNINHKNVIECNSLQDNIRVRRSGTGKVVWRELNKDGSRGFVTDGAARGEAKLAWAIPSRDGGRQLVNPRVI